MSTLGQRVVALLCVTGLLAGCAATAVEPLPIVGKQQSDAALISRRPGEVSAGTAESLERLSNRMNTVQWSYAQAIDISRDLAAAGPGVSGPARVISERISEARSAASGGRIAEARLALIQAQRAMSEATLAASDRRLLEINLDLGRAAVAGAEAVRKTGAEQRAGLEQSLAFATKAAEASGSALGGGLLAATDAGSLSIDATVEYNRSRRGGYGNIVARPMTDAEKNLVLAARAHHARAAALSQLQRDGEAIQANARAEALADDLPRDTQQWLKALISHQKATLQSGAGRDAEAEATLTKARTDLRRTAAQSRFEAFLLRSLADVQGRLNKGAAAKQSQSESFDILVQQSDGSPPTRDDVTPYLALLAPSAVAGNAEDVARFFAVASVAIETETAGAVADVAARFASDDTATGTAIRALQVRRRSLAEAQGKQARVADEQATEDQINAAETAVRSARNAVADAEEEARRVGGAKAGAILSPKTDLAELQAALEPDETYVRFIFLDDGGYAMMATRDTARVLKLGLTEAQAREMTDEIRQSARLISLPEGGQALPRFRTARAAELYTRLFGGLNLDFARTQRLVVEPAGPLFSLPFAALLTEPLSASSRATLNSTGGVDYSSASWLGKRAAVELSVGAASFVRLRAAQRSGAGKGLLAFANPTPSANPAADALTIGRARSLARSEGAELDPRLAATCSREAAGLLALPVLSDAQTEAQAAVERMGAGSRVISGAAFNDQAVIQQADLDQYGTLLFATHAGLPNASDCWPDPYLVTSRGTGPFSDGVLETVEIANLNLNADLVVLSACDTAAGDGRGQALGGLAQSFVFAGSRGVVVSHWPVSSTGAAALSSAMFRRLGEGQSPSDALAGAERALIAEAALSHPYYWAAFTLVGGSPRAGNAPLTTS